MLLLVVLIGYISAQTTTYKKFEFFDCGSKNVQIKALDLTPIPIITPGTAHLRLNVEALEPISGVISANLTIKRKVSGITLPINCYKVDGKEVGSCAYKDLCGLMKSLFPMEKDE